MDSSNKNVSGSGESSRISKSVLFVIPSMDCGGAERVLSLMANYWVNRGWSVSIVSLRSREQFSFYPLDPRIGCINLITPRDELTLLSRLTNLSSRLCGLRKAVVGIHPDVVIAFLEWASVETLLALLGLRVPIVVSVRSDPRFDPPERKLRFLRSMLFPLSAAVVFQSTWAVSCFSKWIQRKAVVIPNAVQLPPAVIPEADRQRENSIAAAGRLTQQKGFDILLSAFALISTRYPDWRLNIYGDGPDRTKLDQQIGRLGLESQASLRGTTENLYRELCASEIFVLPSRWEGFPNALCEAMALGLPVVASATSGAVPDIVHNQVNGILVTPANIQGLADALERLIRDSDLRQRLGSRAAEIVDRYSVGGVMDEWTKLVLRLSPG